MDAVLASPIQAISGIAGSVSIACWLVVFSPQIIENFRRSSAEGLSIRFVIVWLSGDVFNVLGGVLQGVLPTMIILAVYYMLADIVLLSQCFYYKGFTLRDDVHSNRAEEAPSETTSLLASSTATALNQSQQRQVDGTHLSPAVPLHDPKHASRPPPGRTPLQKFLMNLTVVIVVIASGVLGWWLSHRPASRHAQPKPLPDEDTLVFVPLGQVFGYICAVLYLGSRLPQLLLNYRRKSTDGISMLFFVFACIGNLTYVLSVVAFDPVCHRPGHCMDGEQRALYGRYILINLSWLLGSFGTFCLDLVVFGQFFAYRTTVRDARSTENEGTENVVRQGQTSEEEVDWHDNPDS